MSKSNLLSNEVSLIVNQEILDFTKFILENCPDEFYSKPASSTAKYHPVSSLGEGGLLRHTKQVVHIAKAMIETKLYTVDRDIVLSACILHDAWKYEPGDFHTVRLHALLAVKRIDELCKKHEKFTFGEPIWYRKILNAIQSHNGKFVQNQEWDWDNCPPTQEQIIVQVSDWLASRRFLVFDQNLV